MRPSQFEQVIESRSATPKPAGQPRNDTGVITHALAAAVKRWNRNSYHSVTRIRRVETSACLLTPSRRAPARTRGPDGLMSVNVKVTVLVGGVGGARFLLGVQHLLGAGPVRRCVTTRRSRTDRGRQRRRRRVDVRRADLPGPRHLHVHPGRRHRPRARLGSSRRNLARQGGTRRLRRAARLVRPRRPRPGHPSGPQPDAAGRLSAVAGDRGAVRPMVARRTAAARQRRPQRNPRRHHRSGPTARSGRSTSRSGGCATAPRCPPTASRSSAPTRPPRAPASSRPSKPPTSCFLAPSNPVVSIGAILAVPGIRGALRSTTARGHRLLPHHRRKAVARHGRRMPVGDRGGQHLRSGRRPLRCPLAASASSTAGWCTRATTPRSTASRCGRCRC